MTTDFQEINLAKIAPCPLNPRRDFSGPKFDELVASVKAKGVIEPIIVRPKKKSMTVFEIVAGERRFRASKEAGLTTIPAIVRELSDDEAYDFMLIENLQRSDLTELEEAESFKAYADRHAKDGAAIATFCEKTGIRPAYVRARIAVLALPKDVLALWKAGKLAFGHLHQLLRVSDLKARKDLADRLQGRGHSWRINTVTELKREIDEMQIPLGAAKFPTKTECAGCRDNTTVQADLFGFEPGKAACTKPACFRERQRSWLTMNWEKTTYRKENKTNGVRFEGEMNPNAWEVFETWSFIPKPAAKCLTCESFVTIIDAGGGVFRGQACIKPSCYKTLRAEKGKAEKKAKAGDAPAPRASWHGEYFRDVFFRDALDAKAADLDPHSGPVIRILVALLVNQAKADLDPVNECLGVKPERGYSFINSRQTFAAIMGAPEEKLEEAARLAIKAVLGAGQVGNDYTGIGMTNRAAVGGFLGINLASEFAVTEEYLAKKTTAEILAFVKKFDLAGDPHFFAGNPGLVPGKAKKSDLVKAVLSLGPDLVGKVPDEILNVGRGE